MSNSQLLNTVSHSYNRKGSKVTSWTAVSRDDPGAMGGGGGGGDVVCKTLFRLLLMKRFNFSASDSTVLRTVISCAVIEVENSPEMENRKHKMD